VSEHDSSKEIDDHTAYVFASGTSAGAALRAQAAVREVFGTCELRTRQEEDFHYTRNDWGFGFTELSRDDAIEGPLQVSLDEFDQDVADLARGPASPFVEPFSFILVGIAFVAGAIASGFGQRAGEDLYDTAKARLTGRTGDPTPDPDVDVRLAQVFDGLGHSYGRASVAGGPIFLRVRGPDVTFLCEPDLPSAAVRAATALVLRGDLGAAETSRPLRWSPDTGRWEPLPKGWADKKVMRKLNRELSARAKDEH
jgi:hypothetical protein